MDALKDEVVQDVGCEERRIQENARIEVCAKAFLVVRGPGQGVDPQHRPTDDVQVHLYVETLVKEGQLQGAPFPEGEEGVLYLPLRAAEHRKNLQR